MDEAPAPRATAAQPHGPLSGDVIADKYVVERIVGYGGMGVVVAARHTKLQQTVAIKLLTVQDGQQPEANSRLLREAQLSASLRSDHVVRVFDVGTLEDGSPFLVMELLEGRDLADVIEERGPHPVAEAVQIVLQACDAIAEAHAAGIVHRDLKPSNLFMTQRRDGTPQVKVLDFGISKLIRRDATLEGTLTSTRSVMGSPFYMSPEQLRDAKSVDARTDIWSLGVILQELLTAEPAFFGETLPSVCAAIVADPPRPIGDARSDVPPALQDIISLCLEKSPSARFQSVNDLVQALRPFAGAQGRSMAPRVALAGGSGSFPVAKADRLSATRISAFEAAATQASLTSSGLKVGPTSPRRRALAYALGALVAVAAIGAVALTLRRGSSAPAAAVQPAGFTLRVESRPTGAELFEGELRLGVTPIDVPLPAEGAKDTPRVFTLRHAGYEPYTLRQGPATGDVRVEAILAALPSEAPSVAPALPGMGSAPAAAVAPEAPHTTPSSTPRPAAAAAPVPGAARPKAPTSSAAPTSTEPDIRLVR